MGYSIGLVGAGIGGLTTALALQRAGHQVRVLEAAPELGALGVGINVLPHASRVLADLGVLDELLECAVATEASVYFTRFGQLVHREPLGSAAGYRYPQLSIHRGELHGVLLRAAVDRLGADAVHTGVSAVGVEQGRDSATVLLTDTVTGESVASQTFDVVVGCDGVHSVVRRQLHADEGAPRYSGVNMWRGTTVHPPILGGATMIRVGWLSHGKLVIYPIRDQVDNAGNQLVNWVAEIETERHGEREWNAEAGADDFAEAFTDWRFDWLDVPELIAGAKQILEYPMVDQDPLDWWGDGRVTLLGDAAHPMVPRGSNGAGQAILDAEALAAALTESQDAVSALQRYEAERRSATAKVVLANRTSPPDSILRMVHERSGDQPFNDIADIISTPEIDGILRRYRITAGVDTAATLRTVSD